MVKNLVWKFIQFNPFGYYAVFKYGELTVSVDKQFYAHISDGTSVDMLPITFCSQQLVDKFEQEMLDKWYFPKDKEELYE